VKDIRTKIAVVAVVFGLGGLGGYAMASNPAAGQAPLKGAPVASHAGQAALRVTTGASGAANAQAINAPASQTLPRRSAIDGGGQDD
jgi:hypothetical protein